MTAEFVRSSAVGLLDFVRGIKRPDSNAAVLPAEQVRAAILAINRPTAPFIIREGGEGDEGDLVAEWRVADMQWHNVFNQARLKKQFTVSMRFDVENVEVRSVDEQRSLSWKLGVTGASYQSSKARGRMYQNSYTLTATPFYEHGETGQVYAYRFHTSELKKPLQQAVLSAGWTWRSIAGGKL
ncbi:hypothetical protein IQ251_14470 [Saccharopolyspora sp. HNM0983]|uniref:Uncharacterized protein n=1 Tax=Saccharopolyspora montiporae TaxID=2781240 RepID=A0A929G0T4_9PSEU|nr:hypothetical protein [Saccharopolyspora sp. HNM0983]MBE9375654.1 hypothetical protein [Saccharopolyspora sp. HNM0983]